VWVKLQVGFKERRFSIAGLPLPVLGNTTFLEEARPLEPVSFTPRRHRIVAIFRLVRYDARSRFS